MPFLLTKDVLGTRVQWLNNATSWKLTRKGWARADVGVQVLMIIRTDFHFSLRGITLIQTGARKEGKSFSLIMTEISFSSSQPFESVYRFKLVNWGRQLRNILNGIETEEFLMGSFNFRIDLKF